jgi:hypothetical protein
MVLLSKVTWLATIDAGMEVLDGATDCLAERSLLPPRCVVVDDEEGLETSAIV